MATPASPMDFDDSALLGDLLRDDADGDEWLSLAQNTLQQGWHAPVALHGRDQLRQTEALAAPQLEPQEQQQQQQQQQLQQLLRIGQQPGQRVSSDGPSNTQNDTMQHSGDADEHDASSKQPPATNARAAVRRAAKARERAAIADLEVRLQNVSALHVQLLAENGMLRRRMRLLESGVQMREQHLQSLLKARRDRPRARSHSSSGLPAGSRADGADASGGKASTAKEPCRKPAAEGAAAGTAAWLPELTTGAAAALTVTDVLVPDVSMSPDLAQGDAAADGSAALNGAAQQLAPAAGSTAAKKDTTDATAATPFLGGVSHAGPSNNGTSATAEPPLCWTSFSQFADPEAWDTEMCAIVRGLCPHDYQRMWTDFCREASLLAVSAQAHGPGSDSAVALAGLVSTCLSVTDRIAALNPCAYNESMYINLLTGKPQVPFVCNPLPLTVRQCSAKCWLQVPGDDYWRACMRIVPMTAEQLEFCRTAMGEWSLHLAHDQVWRAHGHTRVTCSRPPLARVLPR
eukprot:365949-Chlamydomonas_euryale.AAC.15